MKKTNIALAIFSAIALAACGGSSNDDAVDNSSNTGTVQPGINNGNTGTVQPGNNGNTNTNTGDTNTNTDDTNTNTGNNNAGNNNAGNTNTGNNNAGNTNTGTTTPTKPTTPIKPTTPTTPTKPTTPEQPKPPMTSDVTGAEKIGLSKDNNKVYAGFASKNAQTIDLTDGTKYLGAKLKINDNLKKNFEEKIGYVPAPNLLNDKNELTGNITISKKTNFYDPVNGATNAFTAHQIAYMDDGKIKKAIVIKNDRKLYRQNADGTVGQSLTKDEVYQKVDTTDLNNKTTINSVKIFGQPLAITTDAVDNKINVGQLNRGIITKGEVVDASIKYNVRLNTRQLKLKDDGTGFELDENAGVTPNLTRNVDVTAVKLKAYNLPFVMTTFSFDKTGINGKAGNYLSGSTTDRGNVLFYGNKTINLPTVIADYQGKVFTPTSTGDLNMTVELDDNQVRFHKVDITGRSKSAPDLQLKGTPTVQSHENSYFVNLKRVDDDSIANGDIHALVGDFYGLKAENTAGVLVKEHLEKSDKGIIVKGNTGSNPDKFDKDGNIIGAFAAEQK